MSVMKKWLSAVRLFRVGPASRVAIGLTSIMLACLTALDLVWGVLPDDTPLTKQVRERTSELVALQSTVALGSNDPKSLPLVLHGALKRDPQVRSVALRRADGTIVAQAGDHAALWKPQSDSRSDL